MRVQSFIGQAKTSIDSKGRTAFPREFRRYLETEDGTEVVISPGPNHSLILFTAKEWNQFMAEMDARPRTRQNLVFAEQLVSNSHPCEMDGQNRISLTPKLLEYGRFDGEVLFTARRGKTLSLWNPGHYETQYGLQNEDALEAFNAGFWPEETREET